MEEDDQYLKRVAKALKFLEGLESLDSEQLFLLKRILKGETYEKEE